MLSVVPMRAASSASWLDVSFSVPSFSKSEVESGDALVVFAFIGAAGDDA